MATKPKVSTLEATSPQILNTIRANASPEYRSQVPVAEATTASLREIGSIIMDAQPLRNEFLHALVNRIGRVIITSKMYDNPWAVFKKGLLEYGETVEEIFVNLAKPHDFDPPTAENEVFKREIPDVKAAFHILNYKKFYKTTVSNDELRTAFLSWAGITDLIAKIIDALYTGANYDEFLTMKYLIARIALNGGISAKTISAVTDANAKGIVSTIKGVSNAMEFLSGDYNMTGVKTYTKKSDQFLIMNAAFDAVIDVEVLASAFNMEKAQFMGNRILVDSFSNLDLDRLQELFGEDPNFTLPTTAELSKLDTVVAVILDRNWMMVFDNFYNFTQQYNGEGLYWNYWYHVWKTFSASPFSNAVLFTTASNSITTITITPATATVSPGDNLSLKANATGTGFTPNAVEWAVTGSTNSNTYITPTGQLFVAADETATSLTVMATSISTPTVFGSSTITVTQPTI